MARPSLFQHPKFHRLTYILGIPEPHVLGHLEYLWRVGYSSGNPVIGDELDVEIAAKWVGERGVLTKALIEVRLLDVCTDGRLQIHDLHKNAPNYVRSRARMERYRERMQQLKKPQRLRNRYTSPTPTPTPTPTPGTEGKKIVSSEPLSAHEPTTIPDHGPTLLKFPTVGTAEHEWNLTSGQVTDWRQLFPHLDIEGESRKALAWILASPERRKTARGMPKFLVSWFNRATNSGNGRSPTTGKTAQNIASAIQFIERGKVHH